MNQRKNFWQGCSGFFISPIEETKHIIIEQGSQRRTGMLACRNVVYDCKHQMGRDLVILLSKLFSVKHCRNFPFSRIEGKALRHVSSPP